MIRTTLTIVIVLAVAWFAVTNAGAVTLNLIFWEISASLAIVVFGAFVLGFLLGVVRMAPSLLRSHSKAKSHERSLGKAQKEKAKLSQKLSDLKTRVTQSQHHVSEDDKDSSSA